MKLKVMLVTLSAFISMMTPALACPPECSFPGDCAPPCDKGLPFPYSEGVTADGSGVQYSKYWSGGDDECHFDEATTQAEDNALQDARKQCPGAGIVELTSIYILAQVCEKVSPVSLKGTLTVRAYFTCRFAAQ